MRFFLLPFWFVCLLLPGVQTVQAGNLSPEGIAAQSRSTGSQQLNELRQAMRPEYTSYLAAGWVYLPLPSQTPLYTEWGEHDGYAFRQRLAAWLTNPLEESPRRLGLIWWLERQGWDNEDFLLFPSYGRFARVQSLQTFGLSLSDSAAAWGVAGGAQWLNVEYSGETQYPAADTLYWWGLGEWGPLSVLALYQGMNWREWRVSLDLQSRALRGGDSSGWKTYLPDLDVALRRGLRERFRWVWDQNLYAQQVYVVSAWTEARGLEWARLRLHPEASRLVSLDMCYTRPERGQGFWGGGVSLPFLRLAYNHSDDYEMLMRARGVWVVEFRLAIGSAGNSFFGLGAARKALTESMTSTLGETEKPSLDAGQVEKGGAK